MLIPDRMHCLILTSCSCLTAGKTKLCLGWEVLSQMLVYLLPDCIGHKRLWGGSEGPVWHCGLYVCSPGCISPAGMTAGHLWPALLLAASLLLCEVLCWDLRDVCCYEFKRKITVCSWTSTSYSNYPVVQLLLHNGRSCGRYLRTRARRKSFQLSEPHLKQLLWNKQIRFKEQFIFSHDHFLKLVCGFRSLFADIQQMAE